MIPPNSLIGRWLKKSRFPICIQTAKPLFSRSFNMQDLVTSLSAQAQSLSAEDRARLAESLLASLDPRVADVEAAWAQEISKRVAEVESQHKQLIPAENVFAHVRTKLQQ
jgi:putative addiction module component (TIGR02574 family)